MLKISFHHYNKCGVGFARTQNTLLFARNGKTTPQQVYYSAKKSYPLLGIYQGESFPKNTRLSPNAFSPPHFLNPLSSLPRCSLPPPRPSLSPLSSLLSVPIPSRLLLRLWLSRHVYFERCTCFTVSFRRKRSKCKNLRLES